MQAMSKAVHLSSSNFMILKFWFYFYCVLFVLGDCHLEASS